MCNISENNNFCNKDMLMEARANLEQDLQEESHRNDVVRR